MSISGQRAPVADVLAALAGELALARSKCVRLDDALGRLLEAAAPEARDAVLRELHAVDLLNQQIAAVTTFVEQLSGGAPDAVIDVGAALQAITLGEVAARLGRGVGRAPAPAAAADEAEFF